MARINYPDDFTGQIKLFNAILKQNAVLGAKSPLIAYCKEHDLDITQLQNLIEPATAQDDQRIAMERSSENNTQQRNGKFTPVWKNFIGAVQFLKEFYRSNERKLGDWFITVDGTKKIVYPPDFAARAKQVQDFYGKHNSYPPGESPLQMYLDEHALHPATDLDAVAAALQSDAGKAEQDAASKMATQQRNTTWQPAADAIRMFGAFLMNLYREDSRKMGVWGFDVVEDAANGREQTSTLKPLEKRLQKSIKVGTLFTNAGETDLQVTKGEKKESETQTIKPGEQLGMTKGYSSIQVVNLSSLAEGKYTVIVNK